jgi:hypothetical protein
MLSLVGQADLQNSINELSFRADGTDKVFLVALSEIRSDFRRNRTDG